MVQKEVTNKRLKADLVRLLKELGGDIDGDVLNYEGEYYYVNVLEDKVYQMKYSRKNPLL